MTIRSFTLFCLRTSFNGSNMLFLLSLSSFASPATVLQSDDIKIDQFIEQLESSPSSSGTWDILNSSISHTFVGRTSMATRWIEESELSQKVLDNMHKEVLYIYPRHTANPC